MTILGLSNKRRIPRAGKIRLGVMVEKNGKRYPRAVDHFVCPPEVRQVFGEEPKSLAIIFPSDDPDVLFPQAYQYYKSSGLFCRGDGAEALRWQGNELAKVACPCPFLESGECKPLATLNFFLPDVRGIGVYQLSTSNKASIVSINSGLEEFAAIFGGLRGIPFTLLLEPQKVQRYDETKRAQVQTTIYVLRLDSEYTLRQIVAWREKAGKAVEALMPAQDTDEHEVAVLTAREVETEPEDNGAAEPTSPPDSPGGRTDPPAETLFGNTFIPPERPQGGGDRVTFTRTGLALGLTGTVHAGKVAGPLTEPIASDAGRRAEALAVILSTLKPLAVEDRREVAKQVLGVSLWSDVEALPLLTLEHALIAESVGGITRLEGAVIRWKEAHPGTVIS